MMNYKETLFFIGKCLTINHEPHNRILVENQLKSDSVDWDNVVRVSTAHYVFPALYCNLKRAEFLHYLPNDLVEYMQHITDLNRERNQQIIEQAKEINELLLKNNITPIFLKGTAFLLQNLYEDIAERMVGDIDFLVNPKHIEDTASILKKYNYKPYEKIKFNTKYISRHYTRMIHKDAIGAIEIHYRLVDKPYSAFFNYQYFKNRLKLINNINFLNSEDTSIYVALNKEVNDSGGKTKTIALRNSYDLFLLSKKCTIKKIIENRNEFNPILSNFVASSKLVFNETSSLDYNSSSLIKKHLKDVTKLLDNPKEIAKINKATLKEKTFRRRLKILKLSFIHKDYRKHMMKRLINLKFYKKKLNPNSNS